MKKSVKLAILQVISNMGVIFMFGANISVDTPNWGLRTLAFCLVLLILVSVCYVRGLNEGSRITKEVWKIPPYDK